MFSYFEKASKFMIEENRRLFISWKSESTLIFSGFHFPHIPKKKKIESRKINDKIWNRI
jgi:hypothetical protein